MQPETVFASVDVPHFQPANLTGPCPITTSGPKLLDYDGEGYTRTIQRLHRLQRRW